MKYYFIFLVLLIVTCASDERHKEFDFSKEKKNLIPLHRKIGPVQPGDWLASHKEKNLTLKEYQNQRPVRADKIRNYIYIQPLGDFDETEWKLIETTSEYLSVFYGLKTEILPTKHDSIIPEKYRRIMVMQAQTKRRAGSETTTFWKDTTTEQLQTKYILNNILAPSLPDDAAAMIALCDKDLYPDETWNFVFGQAQLKNRVGVWSFTRFGNLRYANEYNDILLRTLKTASHETGHMFSIKHCSRYYCIMNGSNHLDEADRKPTYFCPDCLEKYCWNFNCDAKTYFERMKGFWEKQGDKKQAEIYSKFIKAIE